jgi:hypothetical protein
MQILERLGIFHLNFLVLIVSISVIGASCSRNETPTVEPKPPGQLGQAFVGCYELALGRWWPWSFGGDTVLVTPPRHIELLPTLGTHGFEKNHHLIRPIRGTDESASARGGPSFWEPKADKQVDLTWADGFTGVTLTLEKQGNELNGWAHPYLDSGILVPRAEHIAGRTIPCPALR